MHTALRTTAAAWQRLSRRAFLTASVLTLATAAACSGKDDGPSGNGKINGSFNLATVEGESLPVTGEINGQDVTVQSGRLTITNEESFTLELRVNGQSFTDRGDITRSGNNIEFDSEVGNAFEGRLSNNNGTVTLNYDMTDEGDVVEMKFNR